MIPWACTLCHRSGSVPAPDPARERIRPLGIVLMERSAAEHAKLGTCPGLFEFEEVTDQTAADQSIFQNGGRCESGGSRVREGVERQ